VADSQLGHFAKQFRHILSPSANNLPNALQESAVYPFAKTPGTSSQSCEMEGTGGGLS